MGSFFSTNKDSGSNSNTTSPSGAVNFHRLRREDEDDFYMVHRKDAIAMGRSASDHFKAAKEASARGDHLSAKRSKRKAHEERIVAKRLQAEAAKNILSFKNCTNNQWKLDLHGLHVDEAVQAVHKQLQKIESTNRLSTTKSSNPFSVILVFLRNFIMKSKRLNVITGRGNHSRGEAKLPVAIRSYLNENKYRYDDKLMPGVIRVQPEFR